uniref:Uncharacterized protein n=1 Tax=Solanum tuberosum TaxID=4113 RepID=M1E0E6_SOLTU
MYPIEGTPQHLNDVRTTALHPLYLDYYMVNKCKRADFLLSLRDQLSILCVDFLDPRRMVLNPATFNLFIERDRGTCTRGTGGAYSDVYDGGGVGVGVTRSVAGSCNALECNSAYLCCRVWSFSGSDSYAGDLDLEFFS